MVKIYFQSTKNSYCELFAVFNSEEDYVDMLEAIHSIRKKRGYDILTEVIYDTSFEEFFKDQEEKCEHDFYAVNQSCERCRKCDKLECDL